MSEKILLMLSRKNKKKKLRQGGDQTQRIFCLICGIPRDSQCSESKKKNPLVASYPLVPSYEEKPPPQIGYSLKPGHAPQCRLWDKAST